MKRTLKSIINFVYYYRFYLHKVNGYSSVVNFRTSCFFGNNLIGDNTEVSNSSFGFASYVAENSVIMDCKIGKFSCIGPNVKIISGQHPIGGFVSLHPAFYDYDARSYYFSFADKNYFEKYKYADKEHKIKVVIGNDVWIAAGVTIIEGVTINDGCVILPCSLVNKSIPSYEVWGGIPARKIRDRFECEEKEQLLKIKWWDTPIEILEENYKEFHDVKNFIKTRVGL